MRVKRTDSTLILYNSLTPLSIEIMVNNVEVIYRYVYMH